MTQWILPFTICGILGFGLYQKVNLFDAFLSGAKEGMKSLVSILPALVGLMAAISMLRASGALDFLAHLLAPLTSRLGIPADVMPLALLRPVSGSGSLAILQDILGKVGADSFAGRLASVMMGSSETTFYALAVYFGAVNVKNTRHTASAALLADLVAVLAATYICYLYF